MGKSKFEDIDNISNPYSLTHTKKTLLDLGELLFETNQLKPFEIQYEAAMALYQGKVVDMKTGEGKTIVSILAAALFALDEEQKVYLITVNEYLTHRDFELFHTFFERLNLTVSQISEKDTYEELQRKYKSSIVFVHNKKLINDYLSDITESKSSSLGIDLDVAIVDEIDSILIDEGGEVFNKAVVMDSIEEEKLQNYIRFTKELSDEDFSMDKEYAKYILTQSGIEKASAYFSLEEDYYAIENFSKREEISKALTAINKYHINENYIVANDEVILINHSNGRINKGTRVTNGVHQYIEVKENVPVKADLKTIYSICYGLFYHQFNTLCGLSGTINTEEKDMKNIYNKEIVSFERRKPLNLTVHDDVLCKNNEDRFAQVIKKINELHKKGQPVLCIAKAIEDAETLYTMLSNDKASLLSAKNHFEEANILKCAGTTNAITIATVMAGRGVDIIVEQQVNESKGGLFVLGLEHFDTKRIDNQVIGRTCRQGAPGECIFFVSLEEQGFLSQQLASLSFVENKLNLLTKRNFAQEEVKKMIDTLQNESELHTSENRLLSIDLFSNISEECLALFKQKKEIVLANGEQLLSILNKILIKNNIANLSISCNHEQLVTFKKEVLALIDDKWEQFFKKDRNIQQILLSRYGSNAEFVLRYKESNIKRWNNLLKELRKEIIEMLNDSVGGMDEKN